MAAVLHFVPDCPEADRDNIARLVHWYYPGLLERGVMPWSVLHRNRTRRCGGMPAKTAESIFGMFNAARPAESRLDAEKVSGWPMTLGVAQRLARSETGPSAPAPPKVPLPLPPRPPGSKQMVYGFFGKPMLEYDYDEARFIVSPWNHNFDLDEHAALSPNGAYSVPVGIAATSIVMRHSECEYPLRIVLEAGWEKNVDRQKFFARPATQLRAVILLRFEVDPAADDVFGAPPHVRRGFIPLFVFGSDAAQPNPRFGMNHLYGAYRLHNYAGNAVDWGDFSKRKRTTYYELRDIMAHLATEGTDDRPRWTMLELDPSAGSLPGMRHYFLRNTLPDPVAEAGRLREEQEGARGGHALRPVCIAWDEELHSLRIVPRTPAEVEAGTRCTYDGDARDFQLPGLDALDRRLGTRFGDPSNTQTVAEATAGVLAGDFVGRVGVVNLDAPPTEYDRGMFGMYGEVTEDGVRPFTGFPHLETAVRFWAGVGQEDHYMGKPNPMDVLCAVYAVEGPIDGGRRPMAVRPDSFGSLDRRRGRGEGEASGPPGPPMEGRWPPLRPDQMKPGCTRWGGGDGSRRPARGVLGAVCCLAIAVCALLPPRAAACAPGGGSQSFWKRV